MFFLASIIAKFRHFPAPDSPPEKPASANSGQIQPPLRTPNPALDAAALSAFARLQAELARQDAEITRLRAIERRAVAQEAEAVTRARGEARVREIARNLRP